MKLTILKYCKILVMLHDKEIKENKYIYLKLYTHTYS